MEQNGPDGREEGDAMVQRGGEGEVEGEARREDREDLRAELDWPG
ncbi:hypothetical protein CKAH01_05893 [Colletotrichum kahawae]|uniref:Uncharacterized protein n=1 Tax=Colletotrichum kahawae TaxID=34407 RepID=A0AAE0D7D5_COLKA|nr:hypothetical protein CKAH01_05893 [Colletotrichum kahawae]